MGKMNMDIKIPNFSEDERFTQISAKESDILEIISGDVVFQIQIGKARQEAGVPQAGFNFDFPLLKNNPESIRNINQKVVIKHSDLLMHAYNLPFPWLSIFQMIIIFNVAVKIRDDYQPIKITGQNRKLTIDLYENIPLTTIYERLKANKTFNDSLKKLPRTPNSKIENIEFTKEIMEIKKHSIKKGGKLYSYGEVVDILERKYGNNGKVIIPTYDVAPKMSGRFEKKIQKMSSFDHKKVDLLKFVLDAQSLDQLLHK